MRDLFYFIGSLAGAAVLTALAIVVPPESLVWRVVLYVGIAVFVAAAIGILIDMFAPKIAMSKKLRLTVYGFLAAAALVGAGWFYIQFPRSLELARGWFPPLMVPKPPPAPPPIAPPRKTEATWSGGRYICKNNVLAPTKEEADTIALNFKSYIESWAVIYYFKPPVVTAVPNGSKAELAAIAGDNPSRRTFQIVRLGKELVGNYTADYWPVYGSQPMAPNSPAETLLRKTIEGLANVSPGDCELQ